MKSFSYTIKDKTGIHARPAGFLSKLAREFESEILIEKDGQKVSASKLMMLMSLGVKYKDTVKVTIEGEDEEEAEKRLLEFFSKNL